jgi:protein-disulfide isomerase
VPVSERDHIKGPASALVTLVEYGDYECPYCGAAYPVVEEILRAMGKRLRFVFRHFPLSQMHPHAQDAAEAAEAAAAQDKFWDMHGMLYTHQEALDESDLLTYAVALGLDPKPVRKALEEDAYLDRVREDFISGARSGVNGTPSFFIEGVRYDGPHDFDSFLAVLVEAADNKAR